MSVSPAPARIPLVAIVGNPNAGKTTLFNNLTGARQKVGNYPGVTVERVSGTLNLEGKPVECLDVPGLYSLVPVSEDERVAADAIFGGTDAGKPDLLVCVVDASNLERNLFLFTQVAELGIPTLVALTMVDRVEQSGRDLDLAKLSNLLGVEVVPVVGHKNRGMAPLKEAIARNLESPRKPNADIALPNALETKAAALRERLARIGSDLSQGEVRRLLLNPSDDFKAFLRDFPEIDEAFVAARSQLKEEGLDRPALDVQSRYQWTAMVQRAVITDRASGRKRTWTDRLDAILVHRVFGLIVFVGLMYLVFQSIYTFAGPVMDLIDQGFTWLKDTVSPRLESTPVLQSLVVDGIIGGVGGVVIFLPQILILFFFIALLEGTGYLARAAFLMDRLLGWCGLNGRAFIPLLSSFACAIPGVMAARVMPDQKSRLATILVAPLMSCSARLPVYLLIISAFIQPQFGNFWAGFALFAMHFLGLLVAIPIVWVINRKMLKGRRLPFLLELPPYQWPRWRDVWLAMYFRGKIFLQTAGTVILAMSVVIWALTYFPRLTPEQQSQARTVFVQKNPSAEESAIESHLLEQQTEHSYLGRFGKAIEPVFIPAGFDWRITTAILAAFPAREVVVPSLGIIFSLGGETDEESTDLREALKTATWPDGRKLMDPWTAVGLMVFFALCCQCMSTLAAIKRETNSWKWPLFVFTYMTALAYIFAVAIHQLSR